MRIIAQCLGVIGFLSVVCLPGAWLTFSLRLAGFCFWERFFTGVVLAPVVVGIEFYLFRFLGIAFEATVYWVVGINAGAAYLIWQRARGFRLPRWDEVLGYAVIVGILSIAIAPQVLDSQGRLYTGHAWMHTDVVYMIANGELFLEEPELAGVTLDYPWGGHIYQGILSYLVGASPAANYIWSNLLWLCLIGFFAARAASLFGGNHWARVGSVLALFFGVNFVGYAFVWALGPYVEKILPLWLFGDVRYTPWVLKFLFFNQMPFSLAMFAAMVYIAVKLPASKLTLDYLGILGLLLVGIGLIYPILFPAACSILIARILVRFASRRDGTDSFRTEWIGLSVVLLLAGAVTALHTNLVTQDRVLGAVQLRYRPMQIALMTLKSTIVTLPLLIGLGWAFGNAWKRSPGGCLIALLSAAGSLALHALFQLNGTWVNQYKYIFTAAICLAPFAGLALQGLLERSGKWAIPLVASIGLVAAMPLVRAAYVGRVNWMPPAASRPLVNAGNFDLRLAGNGDLAALCDAIRLKTPRDAILILESASVHFPTLARRTLFVSPANDNRAGVNISSDFLLHQTKGYDQKLIDHRRYVQSELFRARDWQKIEKSIREMLWLRKPLTIVLEKNRHQFLLDQLAAKQFGEVVYQGGKYVLWGIGTSVKAHDVST
jgi:hypothetical protein